MKPYLPLRAVGAFALLVAALALFPAASASGSGA